MRTVAFALSLFALPISASNLWFDPPNPTSRTPVTAHIQASIPCLPNGATASINGHTVSITLRQIEPCTVPPPLNGFQWTVDLGVLPAGVYDVLLGQEGILILLGEATLPVADVAPPITIEPNVGYQGQTVAILGSGIAPVCAVAPCPTPVVTFGGVRAPVTAAQSTDEISVTVPAHDPGVVDVSVIVGATTPTATAAFDYPDASKPFDPAFFEPVLFPVMINGPGALGSLWSTGVSLRNENDYVLAVSSIFDTLCFPVCDQRPAAHSTKLRSDLSFPSGYLLYVPRQAAPNLSFGTLVRDLSRQAQTLGTETPVVHEKDFFDRSFTLLNVPTDARYRVALRFYRVDDIFNVHFTIRPLMSEDAPLVDTFAFLAKPDPTSSLSYETAYIGDLLATYPQLAGKGPLRIQIDPASSQRATWAFVSVTNNDTQDVTIISPH